VIDDEIVPNVNEAMSELSEFVKRLPLSVLLEGCDIHRKVRAAAHVAAARAQDLTLAIRGSLDDLSPKQRSILEKERLDPDDYESLPKLLAAGFLIGNTSVWELTALGNELRTQARYGKPPPQN
jgi:hypothetical protein